MEQNQRHIWIDALRIIAGLSMVILHSTADPNGGPWVAYSEGERIGPLLIRALVYTARTELFIIISIFLLFMAHDRRPRGYRETIGENARRLLLPFAFWTFFYATFGLIKANAFGYQDSALTLLMSPEKWLNFFLLGSVKYHMHFVPTLFAILLFYPLFRFAIKTPFFGLGILLCLAARRELDGYIYPHYWGTDALPYLVRGAKILTYTGYGLIAASAFGVWKRSNGIGLTRWFPVVMVLGGILFVFKLIASYKTMETGAWPFNYVPGYWADYLMPVLLFAGCMSLASKNWSAKLSIVAPYSFGIYLCHPIFMDLVEILLRGQDFAPLTQVILKISIVIPLTSLLVVSLKRSSFMGWTIGLGALPRIRFPKFRKVEKI